MLWGLLADFYLFKKKSLFVIMETACSKTILAPDSTDLFY